MTIAREAKAASAIYFVNSAKAPFQSSGGGFIRYPRIRASYKL
jgi:hypothetical protein